MPCALVLAVRPASNHVSAVDDIGVLYGWHGEPFFLSVVPDFQAVRSGLLKQYGDATKVGVRSDADLAGDMILG